MKDPNTATWLDITEEKLPDNLLAAIDRKDPKITSTFQESWDNRGIVYLPNFLPDHLIENYSKVREALNRPGGWRSATPYMHVPELRDISLFPELMTILEHLIGEPMGLHLNLTGWVSTERDFHQDTYLNPEFVGTHYAAVWMALDDIHPDSGPFQFFEGSHRWPVIRRHKVFEYLSDVQQADPAWPTFTQQWVSRCCLEEAVRRDHLFDTYTPKKGDVLIWHSNLVHRGSPPNVPGMRRKSLIAHYSSIHKRPDMPTAVQDQNGAYYFPFPNQPLE